MTTLDTLKTVAFIADGNFTPESEKALRGQMEQSKMLYPEQFDDVVEFLLERTGDKVQAVIFDYVDSPEEGINLGGTEDDPMLAPGNPENN